MKKQTLHELRKSGGYTQKEIAGKIHVAVSTYCRYEKGEIDIPASTLRKLADFYEVTMESILL